MTLPKDPEKLATYREKARVYAREYHQRMRDDPEYRARAKERSRAYYREKGMSQASRSRQREKVREGREYMNQVKASVGCSRCGERNPIVLEFHHREPGEKEYSVSQMCGMNRERMDAEIAKCDILCANCHCIVHHEIGGKGRPLANQGDA